MDENRTEGFPVFDLEAFFTGTFPMPALTFPYSSITLNARAPVILV